jgi:hypothetical protein
MSRLKPGYFTVRNASRIWSWVIMVEIKENAGNDTLDDAGHGAN